MLNLRKTALIYYFFVVLFATLLLYSNYSYANPPIRHIKTNEKVVALTFDDGPSIPYTEQILTVLAKYNVKATFYVLGTNAKTYPKIIKKIINQGHELGNHSMYHHKLNKKSVPNIIKDIQQTDTILRQLGYTKEITFRAPYGLTSKNIDIAMTNMNKKHVLFEFLPQDWKKISANNIYNNVMQRVRPGLIITLHDGGKRRTNTVIATEMIIKTLLNQGYRFETIQNLLPD